MKFSTILWQKHQSIYQEIIDHPFNRELMEGTLSWDQFIFYLQQDAYYLVYFSQALAFIAARANSSKLINHFLHFSLGALNAERELHASFLHSEDDWEKIVPSPACMGYTQYLIATASTASLEEAIAAVLPCFWIYRNVGSHIAAHAKGQNPYHRWIETYSSQEFSEATDLAISLLDEVASECVDNTLMRMERAFRYSVLYEWHFWNDAYQMAVLTPECYLFRCKGK